MQDLENVKKLLIQNNQTTVLSIFEKVDNKESLANQILKVDFNKMNDLYNNREEKIEQTSKIEPIKYIDKNKLEPEVKKELDDLGEKVIKDGQYAVVTMAGGQGTRLGWKGPKGTFKLDIGENGKYIFEILTETLKRANEKYNSEVYWYIMTSIQNNDETISFFEEHNYFGYNKEKVKFFKQGVLPLLDFEGNLLIDKDFNIKEASDGNGGVFGALKESGMLEDMRKHNVQWAFIGGVDNIMAKMVDSTLVGLAIKNKTLAASKSIKKAYPKEKVGSFCKKNGKPAVIEYSEMNDEMIYAKDENGELLYGQSHIVANLFNIEFLEQIANKHFKYHCAVKKNSYIDENLNEIIPNEPNSYKFEAFIFDAFEFLDDISIMSINREEEFAPVKNAEGVDSPESAKKIYENYFSK